MTDIASSGSTPTDAERVPPSTDGTDSGKDLHLGWALVLISLAQLMVVLDGTITNIALPFIGADLGIDQANLSWIVTGYALAFGGLLLLGGRLGDLYGRRRIFATGLVVFAIASLLGGFAQNEAMLLGSRALQGLGAAAMVPQVLSSLQVMYAADERAKAMGAFTALAGMSTVLGPVLGAVLTDANIAGSGWRAIFLVNVPFGIAAIVAALRFIPESRSERRPGLDVRGTPPS